jgi:PKD repeat protein
MTRALVLALLIAGCGDDGGVVDASVPSDLGIGDLGAIFDGPGRLRGAFTVTGCATLDTSTGEPRCSGRAPLTLTFVPLGSGVSAFVWTFDGGTPSTSKAVAPTVVFDTPGTYAVTLAAGGSAGTTTATGAVVVSSATTGSPCLADTDCDARAGLFCVCKPGDPGCVGALAIGFCSRSCSGVACDVGQICADLARGGAYVPSSDGGVSASVWRQALCLPSCTADVDCRIGLSCRELPALSGGAVAGSAFKWKRSCFADVGGDDGDSCFSASGQPDPSLCLSGRCDPYGARGLCTSDCMTSDDCPSTAACAKYNAPPGSELQWSCLRRCPKSTPGCNADPLLDCEDANPTGGLSFTIFPAESSTSYCAPKTCTKAADCAPSGMCMAVGAASYCLNN